MAKSIKNDHTGNVFVTEKFSDAFQTQTNTHSVIEMKKAIFVISVCKKL